MNVNCGVYALINEKNGRTYAGAAVKLNRRIRAHVRALTRGAHKNKEMQADWNRHSFAFTVLEFCSKKMLDSRERHWVSIAGTYNRTPGGRSNIAFINADPVVRALRSVRAKQMHQSGAFNLRKMTASVAREMGAKGLITQARFSHKRKKEIKLKRNMNRKWVYDRWSGKLVARRTFRGI